MYETLILGAAVGLALALLRLLDLLDHLVDRLGRGAAGGAP